MNKTIELVKSWGAYEEAHPNGDINDFCHFYITNQKAKQKSEKFLGENVPPDLHSTLAKLIGRLAKLHSTYAAIALTECGLKSFDEFLYLNSVGKSDAPKKTTVIYGNFNELSSGLLILDRLKTRGLLLEENDQEDKRSKRLKLSKEGDALLTNCYKKMAAINELFFKDISENDISLCIHLLSPVEVNFSLKWLEDKNKSFALLMEEANG